MSDKYNQKWVLALAQNGHSKWAITIDQTTYYSVTEEQVSSTWRRHEECHKRQWKRDGWKFALNYLRYQAKYGYTNNPYEVEARLAENA